jgi:hypothetical protein
MFTDGLKHAVLMFQERVFSDSRMIEYLRKSSSTHEDGSSDRNRKNRVIQNRGSINFATAQAIAAMKSSTEEEILLEKRT